jgi:hypothetical protein
MSGLKYLHTYKYLPTLYYILKVLQVSYYSTVHTYLKDAIRQCTRVFDTILIDDFMLQI